MPTKPDGEYEDSYQKRERLERELQSVFDLPKRRLRDLVHGYSLERELGKERVRVLNRERRDGRDILVIDQHIQTLHFQALAVAHRADLIGPEILCAKTMALGACAVWAVERE